MSDAAHKVLYTGRADLRAALDTVAPGDTILVETETAEYCNVTRLLGGKGWYVLDVASGEYEGPFQYTRHAVECIADILTGGN